MDAVFFGHPGTALLYCLFTWVLFLGVGLGLYLLLTTDNSLRKEFQNAFGRRESKVSKGQAAKWIGIPVLLLIAWHYHANLYQRFFAVQSVNGTGDSNQWKLLFQFPDRSVSISNSEILGWHSQIDWSQRGPRRSLVLVLTNGLTFRSSAWNPISHKQALEELESKGVDVERH